MQTLKILMWTWKIFLITPVLLDPSFRNTSLNQYLTYCCNFAFSTVYFSHCNITWHIYYKGVKNWDPESSLRQPYFLVEIIHNSPICNVYFMSFLRTPKVSHDISLNPKIWWYTSCSIVVSSHANTADLRRHLIIWRPQNSGETEIGMPQ